MQTVGGPAPLPRADKGRPLVALVVVASAFILTAIGLALARGDAYPADQERWTSLQMAERFNQLYEDGRVDEFQALLHPAARWCHDAECVNSTPFFGSVYLHENQTALESQYLAATGGTLGAECLADGPEVTCMWHQSNVFFEAAGIEPWVGPQTFTVEDGLITRYSGGYRYEGVFVYDRVQQNQYSEWVALSYPGEHGSLFEGQLLLVFTEEARERHRQLTTEWATTFAG